MNGVISAGVVCMHILTLSRLAADTTRTTYSVCWRGISDKSAAVALIAKAMSDASTENAAAAAFKRNSTVLNAPMRRMTKIVGPRGE